MSLRSYHTGAYWLEISECRCRIFIDIYKKEKNGAQFKLHSLVNWPGWLGMWSLPPSIFSQPEISLLHRCSSKFLYYSLNVSLDANERILFVGKRGWRLNDLKTNKGNCSLSFCTFPYSGERKRFFLFLDPQITSSAQFNLTVNTSASAPRPLYSRNTTHTRTISSDRGILDDFLIGFILLPCH